MKGLLYDVVKGNKSNRFYITSAIIATVINLVVLFGVTMNSDVSFHNEILCMMFKVFTLIINIVLSAIVIYLLNVMYNVEAHDIISERAETYIKKEYANEKRIHIVKELEHYVYAKYEGGFVKIATYDIKGKVLETYKTNRFAEFLKDSDPVALKKIKRGIILNEVF